MFWPWLGPNFYRVVEKDENLWSNGGSVWGFYLDLKWLKVGEKKLKEKV